MNLINWLGIGTVAATKQTNTNEIMVHLPSDTPTADGRTVAVVETKEETAVNAAGEPIKVSALIGNTKPAKWNSFGEPNRLTAPEVREGSQVALYQVGGQSTIYWTTYGFSAETFRLETIVWGAQANPSVDENTEFNVDNFYTVMMDTRGKKMSIRTSQSNGEKSGLEVVIDGGEGRIEAVGTNKSAMILDDFNSKYLYTNKEGSVITVDKKKMMFIAPDSMLFNGINTVGILTKVLNVEAQEINVKAATAKIAIGKTTWEGDVDLTGLLKHIGNTQQTGNTVSTGIVQGLGGIKSSTTDLDTHGHSNVENGRGVSGPRVPVPQPPIGGASKMSSDTPPETLG